jgi:hypothetical protein
MHFPCFTAGLTATGGESSPPYAIRAGQHISVD